MENLTCSLNVGFKIPLMDVFEQITKEPFVKRVRLNPERFPGMFITLDFCTFLLFSSGKMIIIGASTIDNIQRGIQIIMTMLNPYKNRSIDKI